MFLHIVMPVVLPFLNCVYLDRFYLFSKECHLCRKTPQCWWDFTPFVMIFQALYNFLSFLKLPYILTFADISQSLEKGHFPVKAHELPVFVDISFFSFLCPFSWRRKCGNRLSLLLIRTYSTSHLLHMGPAL